jgi:phosphotransferase system HPr-like phosphotransfer protein
MSEQQVELSFVYLHARDASKFVTLAEEEQSKLKSLYARHAILSCVFAIEALANKIANEFYILPSGYDTFEKLGLRQKVFILPLVCGKDRPIGHTFDQSKEPFQSFCELVNIRNWLVHPKTKNYVDASKLPGRVVDSETGDEYPWISTDFSGTWPQTNIPLNPFELTGAHARNALNITDKLISELLNLFDGLVTEKWLDEVILKSKDGKEQTKISIKSIWGGYTPE